MITGVVDSATSVSNTLFLFSKEEDQELGIFLIKGALRKAPFWTAMKWPVDSLDIPTALSPSSYPTLFVHHATI